MRQLASLVSAAAVGALLFSVHVAVAAFRDLPDDRVLAGKIAGRAFTGSYAVSAVAAIVALVVVASRRTRHWTFDRTAAALFFAVALVQSLWIAPAIVHHGAGWPGTFASLHATGGTLHLALAGFALLMAWRLLDEPPVAYASGR